MRELEAQVPGELVNRKSPAETLTWWKWHLKIQTLTISQLVLSSTVGRAGDGVDDGCVFVEGLVVGHGEYLHARTMCGY